MEGLSETKRAVKFNEILFCLIKQCIRALLCRDILLKGEVDACLMRPNYSEMKSKI